MILVEEIAVVRRWIVNNAKVMRGQMAKASTWHAADQCAHKPSLDRVHLRPEENTSRIRLLPIVRIHRQSCHSCNLAAMITPIVVLIRDNRSSAQRDSRLLIHILFSTVFHYHFVIYFSE